MALQRGGVAVDDPKAWFDSLPNDVATLWEAYYRLEPWGGDYQRHAVECELLEAIFAKLVNRDVPRERRDLHYEPRKRKQFFPPDYAGEALKKKTQKTSVAKQCDNFVAATLNRSQ